jgi:hypothetical protein
LVVVCGLRRQRPKERQSGNPSPSQSAAECRYSALAAKVNSPHGQRSERLKPASADSYYPAPAGPDTRRGGIRPERTIISVVTGRRLARAALGLSTLLPRNVESRTATEDKNMKHLLNGVAIAAALAVAGPVWAQGTMTPSTPGGSAPPAAAPASPSKTMTPPAAAPASPPTKSMAPAPGSGPSMASPSTPKHRPMHHMVMHRHWMYHGDTMTEQLNREELARIQGGGAPPPPPAPAPGPGAPPPPPMH